MPNIQKLRFCSQNCEIHGNLGGQEPGTKKKNEYLLFEKMRLPSQEPGTKRQSEYLLFEKMRLPKIQIARFCSQNCDIHENLGGQGLGTEKINLNIFYLKKCVGPTCKKLDFAAKIAKFMEIWEVRSHKRKKTI